MENSNILHLPQNDDERERLKTQTTKESEDTLHHYGCALAARGLSKWELSILMRDRNSQLDVPLDEKKVCELIEVTFVFSLKDDVDTQLPVITGCQRQLAPLIGEIYDALQTDATLFRHGGGLVTVRDGAIVHHTQDSIGTLLSRKANFIDTKQNSMFPPVRAGNAVLYDIDDGGRIRPLERVVNVPILREDGTICDSPGYDAASRVFYHPTENTPGIPKHPTRDDAKKAAGWLIDDLLADFPFVEQSDRANYIGLLLTPIIREMCGCTPVALIDAPVKGSGKSLLAKIVAIVTTGASPEFGVLPGDEGEVRKNLTSRLQEAPPILVFDNSDEIIKSSTLAAIVTADVWQDRMLGRNRILHLPVRATFIFTGNNLRLGGDMSRRCYRVHIDANSPKPWTGRKFKHRLPEFATEQRSRIVSYLLLMARAWILANRPPGDSMTLGGFESWSAVVGGILKFAGVNGFLDNLESMYRDTAGDDDDCAQWSVWVSAIFAHFGDHAFTVKELAKAIDGMYAMALKEDAPYSLGEIGKPDDRAWLTKLGCALHNRAGQVFKIGDEDNGELVKLIRCVIDGHRKQKGYRFVKPREK